MDYVHLLEDIPPECSIQLVQAMIPFIKSTVAAIERFFLIAETFMRYVENIRESVG